MDLVGSIWGILREVLAELDDTGAQALPVHLQGTASAQELASARVGGGVVACGACEF